MKSQHIVLSSVDTLLPNLTILYYQRGLILQKLEKRNRIIGGDAIILLYKTNFYIVYVYIVGSNNHNVLLLLLLLLK